MKVYPLFVRVEGAAVVVIGGGRVAAAKLDGLVAAGARVTVVAPQVDDRCRRDGVAVIERRFVPADLDGARFVIAAASPAANRAVAAAAAERGLLVNAVDDPEVATAFLGGVVRRGPITVAISTGGEAPALAGLLREALDASLPHDLDGWLPVARAERARWRRERVAMARRRDQLLDALVAARGRGGA